VERRKEHHLCFVASEEGENDVSLECLVLKGGRRLYVNIERDIE